MQFKELEISGFEGIASSNRHPRKNECQECTNFDTRYVDGDLTLRAGFLEKYPIIAKADHRSKLMVTLTGSIDPAASANVVGVGTLFTTELAIGDSILVSSEERIVATITDNTHLTVTVPFSNNGNDTSPKKIGVSSLEFENFYVPNDGGKEITVWVAKATLVGETGSGNPDIATRNILTVFSSHQFDGTNWVEKNWDGATAGKYWLNHTIATSLHTSTTTHEVILAFIDATIIANNTFNGWTITNISVSPYEVAQVIDTYDAGGGLVGVKITNNSIDWSHEDVLILQKNYIPYDSLVAMYNCTASDITFHKVLNDLRIGFGGYEDRIGLSIGYRKKAFMINDIDWDGGAFDSFIEPLSTINNLILAPYYPMAKLDTYKIEISLSSGSSNELPAGKYFFLLTALLDDYNETLVAKNEITISAAADLVVRPKIKLGPHNKLITKVKLYVAITDSIADSLPTGLYNLLQTYNVAESIYTEGGFVIDAQGELSTPITITEIHTEHNAAINENPDYDATTGFSSRIALTVSSDAVNFVAGIGTHSIKALNSTGDNVSSGEIKLTQTSMFKKGVQYTVTFYAMSSAANKTLGVAIWNQSTGYLEGWTFELDTSFGASPFTFSFVADEDIDEIFFVMSSMANNTYFNIDALSIIAKAQDTFNGDNIPSKGTEIVNSMGYQPTFDMVKSWDQAVVTSGRAFYVNPYIDKRWENKIFRSHISGTGAFMYDAVSAESYIDIEAFDNNDLIGIAVLPNLQILALNRNGAQRVDPDTGAARQVDKGKGCVARKSIINFGDRVVWCNDHDIYMSDGLNVVSIADKTIREAYRAITTKSSIIAIMEEKDNAYRFFTGNTSAKTEYILTKKGWLKRVNGVSYPVAYSTSIDGTVNFMISTGKIYEEDGGENTVLDDNVGLATPVWQSVDIDAELIGESISERDFIYISSMWIDYTLNYAVLDPPTLNFSIYLDGSSYKTQTFTCEPNQRTKQFVRFTGKNCRRFSLYVSVTGNDTTSFVYGKHLSIHSVGVMFKTVPAGHFN